MVKLNFALTSFFFLVCALQRLSASPASSSQYQKESASTWERGFKKKRSRFVCVCNDICSIRTGAQERRRRQLSPIARQLDEKPGGRGGPLPLWLGSTPLSTFLFNLSFRLPPLFFFLPTNSSCSLLLSVPSCAAHRVDWPIAKADRHSHPCLFYLLSLFNVLMSLFLSISFFFSSSSLWYLGVWIFRYTGRVGPRRLSSVTESLLASHVICILLFFFPLFLYFDYFVCCYRCCCLNL